MKKIVLAAMITSGLMAADSGSYIGVEYGAANNTVNRSGALVSSVSVENNYKDIKVKVGGGTDGGWKSQGTMSLISYDKAIFDATNKDLMEFGFDIIKEFEVTSSVYPFIKAGFGAGSMSVEGYTKDSIVAVSFNVGAGISYKVVDHLYLLAGVDYVGRKWQDVEQQYYVSRYIQGTTTVKTSDSAIKPYIGMNYRF